MTTEERLDQLETAVNRLEGIVILIVCRLSETGKHLQKPLVKEAVLDDQLLQVLAHRFRELRRKEFRSGTGMEVSDETT